MIYCWKYKILMIKYISFHQNIVLTKKNILLLETGFLERNVFTKIICPEICKPTSDKKFISSYTMQLNHHKILVHLTSTRFAFVKITWSLLLFDPPPMLLAPVSPLSLTLSSSSFSGLVNHHKHSNSKN